MNKNNKITDQKKYLLFSELHSLLKSGLSFSRSFELLIQNEHKTKDIQRLKQIYSNVINGLEFWKSMETSQAFEKIDSGVIRIGEETGKLDQSLVFLGDYYRKKIEQRRMLTSALSYPVIILATAMLVLTFMMIVVVPMFEQVYSRMGGQLPAITQSIMGISRRVPLILAILGFLIIIFSVFILFYGKEEWFQKATSGVLLKIPLLSDPIRKHYEAQFCKLLYLLLSSDVPLLRSLQMLESIIVFYPYSKSFIYISEELKRGKSFSESLNQFRPIYDQKLITLISVGEETNSLEKMLLSQSEDITSELEHKLKQLGNILEPVLILLIGIIVAFVLIAMYMPMFKLGQTIN